MQIKAGPQFRFLELSDITLPAFSKDSIFQYA